MKIHIETDRLIMRDLTEKDTQGIFELDSEPDVHTYLGNNPIKTLDEAEKIIDFIKKQYTENGIGRWAVVEKRTGNFIGWSGFKLITDTINNKTQYYDLGYRFIKKSWGKGYATETAIASLDFGFNQLNQKEICAIADVENLASNRVLQKIGMTKINEFDYENILHNFYIMNKNE
jgi:ribosomal-protein-alanine N-acetyltransferase